MSSPTFNPGPAACSAFRQVFHDDPMIIRPMPDGSSLHMHTDHSGNYIRSAHIYGANGVRGPELSGYDASMLDARADALGAPRKTRSIY